MTTRAKIIEVIDRMSEAELEVEYARLCAAVSTADEPDSFEEALDALGELADEIDSSLDAAQLIRDERDWHANRVS